MSKAGGSSSETPWALKYVLISIFSTIKKIYIFFFCPILIAPLWTRNEYSLIFPFKQLLFKNTWPLLFLLMIFKTTRCWKKRLHIRKKNLKRHVATQRLMSKISIYLGCGAFILGFTQPFNFLGGIFSPLWIWSGKSIKVIIITIMFSMLNKYFFPIFHIIHFVGEEDKWSPFCAMFINFVRRGFIFLAKMIFKACHNWVWDV